MIDITKLEASSQLTTVNPSDNIFTELGRNTYTYLDLLSELIDNSLAAKSADSILNVSIDLFVDGNGKGVRFVIQDDAVGISADSLGLAITPAGQQAKDSLNEHGLGMKQAVSALGKLEYLATKTESDQRARVIKEFKFGDIPTYTCDFDRDHGTEISIVEPKPILVTHAPTITRSIVPQLGARYRRFLKPDNKKLNLTLSLRSAEKPRLPLNEWKIEEVKPVYFHPSSRSNEPVISKHEIVGNGWSARLTFGYSPNRPEEYEELGLEAGR
jgi:hypothetical protein